MRDLEQDSSSVIRYANDLERSDDKAIKREGNKTRYLLSIDGMLLRCMEKVAMSAGIATLASCRFITGTAIETTIE